MEGRGWQQSKLSSFLIKKGLAETLNSGGGGVVFIQGNGSRGSALQKLQSNPLNGSPDNGSIRLLVQALAGPI